MRIKLPKASAIQVNQTEILTDGQSSIIIWTENLKHGIQLKNQILKDAEKLERMDDLVKTHIYACNEMLKGGIFITDEQKAIKIRYAELLRDFKQFQAILEENP